MVVELKKQQTEDDTKAAAKTALCATQQKKAPHLKAWGLNPPHEGWRRQLSLVRKDLPAQSQYIPKHLEWVILLQCSNENCDECLFFESNSGKVSGDPVRSHYFSLLR
jgi:hypothetical protein